ncbi:uncharacterized protein LOC125523670, partial [Triticum urartu]|uniref:uncharacterized protein LOC125523670 n=1 Tax=Triticum urartu TaxID=4572 RepID=UPI002042C423
MDSASGRDVGGSFMDLLRVADPSIIGRVQCEENNALFDSTVPIELDEINYSNGEHLPSGDCQEKIALVDSPVPINSDEEEYSNDSDYSRLEHNHKSCCIQDNKDDPASLIENDQNRELLCASSANQTSTIRSFSSMAVENDDDDASSKSHCYRFVDQHKVLDANSCFSLIIKSHLAH